MEKPRPCADRPDAPDSGDGEGEHLSLTIDVGHYFYRIILSRVRGGGAGCGGCERSRDEEE